MATTPEKATAITFTSTDLGDSRLPITTFSKSALISWLNSVQGSEIAVFFGSENDASVRLILAENSASGVSGSNHLESASLPCPPYCKT
ncbi:MAG: hypothetical protein R2825_30755 [Saprospiraceae bacterium]